MKPRSIALITHEYYPVLCGGTIMAEKMAIEFSQMGYEVEILTCGVGKGFARLETTPHFKVRRFNTFRKSRHDAKFSELLMFLVLACPQMLFYCLRRRFDILFPIFVIPSGMIAWVISIFTRSPSIVFVDAADTPGIQSAQSQGMKLLTPLFKFVTRFSDGVVVLQGVENLALPLVNNPIVDVIPNGTSIPDEVAKPGSHGDVVQFLSIGRLVLRKGFTEIIEALAIVRQQRSDFHLKIVGYGTREEEIKQALHHHGVQDHVTLVGRVEYAALKQEYLSADYYLFYGAPEGSSLAMIEALSYGLPILASDDLGTRAYIKPGENGFLVEHLNPQQLANAILKILAEKEKISEFGVRSRDAALSFSWANIARRYESTFNRAFKARGN